MIQTRQVNKVVLEEISKVCDRCGKIAEKHSAEWEEFFHLHHICGYGSVFQDCSVANVDLCQNCLKHTIGEWIRIKTK